MVGKWAHFGGSSVKMCCHVEMWKWRLHIKGFIFHLGFGVIIPVRLLFALSDLHLQHRLFTAHFHSVAKVSNVNPVRRSRPYEWSRRSPSSCPRLGRPPTQPMALPVWLPPVKRGENQHAFCLPASCAAWPLYPPTLYISISATYCFAGTAWSRPDWLGNFSDKLDLLLSEFLKALLSDFNPSLHLLRHRSPYSGFIECVYMKLLSLRWFSDTDVYITYLSRAWIFLMEKMFFFQFHNFFASPSMINLSIRLKFLDE